MKSGLEKLREMSPKTEKKLDKFLTDKGMLPIKNVLIAEINSATAIEFKDLHCIVTAHYLFDCGANMGFLNGTSNIIPLERVYHVYRSDITGATTSSPNFDYDNFFLTVELDGNTARTYCCHVPRSEKIMRKFDELVNCIRGKQALLNGGATC